ncbi:aspartate/glutamate racemase family protein [Priestia filamentosa]|nr:aspartate/glutamate racemase family protein [Priestia filamentosa]MDT3763076.1 aspartate/glutamate racemase family protein [Priestia filamentosa]OXS69591.1 Asp/Glu/hydantoin racemase [Priestia filamentosa]RJS63758.1 Asp/Glu/hydantoin racemase [Priestia filamentosa]WCM14098.1 aspartate/glutamate racemase family protein [Priestia filamentosa]WRU97506.1 aspartate/glutamate racemase family protein [Priestia filamentosa]
MASKDYKIGLVHATMNSVQPILEAFEVYEPQVRLINFMDESLIVELNETGIVTKDMKRRLLNLVEKAVQSDVDGVLLTCSSFTPAVEEISHLFDVPVLSADLSMLERAIEIGHRIGVIATVEAAGPTTTKLLEKISCEKRKEISVKTEVIPQAFQALQNRNTAKHDELIHEKVKELSGDCDVILFAQFSMARALKSIDGVTTPILTSPQISVKAIVNEISKREIVL